MQVILLEKIRNLGSLGDKVKVKPGFGRNFLIPQGKAVPATALNISKFEARRAELEKAARENMANAQQRADVLSALTLEVKTKASDEGKLFGSIGVRDVVDAIAAQGQTVNKSEVQLPGGLIRQTGEYYVVIQLHSDVVANVKLVVLPE